MISPWRSAKWPGTSFQPSAPKRYGPPMSSSSASAHSAPCASAVEERGADQQPDADRRAQRQAGHRLAKRRVVAAGEHEQGDVRGAHGSVGEGELERQARRRPRGRRCATIRSAAMAAKIDDPNRALLGVDARWSATRSRSTTTTARRAPACPGPAPPRSAGRHISAVHWVSARTKTRSKKSSSGMHPLPLAHRGAEPGACASSVRGWP